MLLKSDTGRITLYKHVNMTRYGHKALKKQKQNKEQKMLWNSNYCDKIKKEGLKKLKEANTLGAQTINSPPDIGYQQLSLSSYSVAFLFLHDVICLHVNLCNVLM